MILLEVELFTIQIVLDLNDKMLIKTIILNIEINETCQIFVDIARCASVLSPADHKYSSSRSS